MHRRASLRPQNDPTIKADVAALAAAGGNQMESTGARQAREKAVKPSASAGSATSGSGGCTPDVGALHAVGYGMPCANCRAYYPADMEACPICKSRQRISAASAPAVTASPAAPHADEAKRLSEERERLRELKSQIYASHSQMASTTYHCALDQNHDGNVEPAAICHSCYGAVRQQADRMEAALHMDPKEAAKIVYEAVWADASDPNRTYVNAAAALLTELRGRAGISAAPPGKQSLSH